MVKRKANFMEQSTTNLLTGVRQRLDRIGVRL
jgi:hypothetical protein